MVSKAEALGACKSCGKAAIQEGCIVADIEACKDESISAPACMLSFLSSASEQHSPESQKEPLKTSSINESASSINEDGRNKSENSSANSHLHPSLSSIGSKLPLDELDIMILGLLLKSYHERAIARLTGRCRSTIQSRIKRLKNLGLIKPIGKSNERSYPKFYSLTPRGTKILEYDEGGTRITAQQAPFMTSHRNILKFGVLDGILPKSSYPIKMENWTAFDFKFPEDKYTIRIIPSKKNKKRLGWLVVFLNSDLGAGSIDNLNSKYEQLAKGFVGKFAERYELKIGLPERYEKAHYTIPDAALATLLADKGEILTQSGIKIDTSRSKGDIEFEEKTARAFEFTLNQMPIIGGRLLEGFNSLKDGIHQEMEDIQACVKKEVGELKSEVKELPIAIRLQQTQQENEELRTRLQEQESHAPKEESKKHSMEGMFG